MEATKQPPIPSGSGSSQKEQIMSQITVNAFTLRNKSNSKSVTVWASSATQAAQFGRELKVFNHKDTITIRQIDGHAPQHLEVYGVDIDGNHHLLWSANPNK